jgi:predicted patatin/cPLA2 family phospholipase
LQFSIPYLKHNSYFNEAIECLKKQIPILWNENIALKSLLDLVDSRFSDILIKSNSAQQAKLFALYTGSQSQVQNGLNQIQQASKNWNMQMFEVWYGKFDTWLQGLQEKVKSREEFLKQIEANKQDKKILQLKSSELTA